MSERPFELSGINHLALVCRDMARTVDFYSGVLGMPLVKTILPFDMGQHFFFDCGGGDCLAFFWFPDAPEPAPGVSAPKARPDQGELTSAIGSMNHVAFNVAPERIEDYRDRLLAAGVDCTEVANHDDSEYGLSKKMPRACSSAPSTSRTRRHPPRVRSLDPRARPGRRPPRARHGRAGRYGLTASRSFGYSPVAARQASAAPRPPCGPRRTPRPRRRSRRAPRPRTCGPPPGWPEDRCPVAATSPAAPGEPPRPPARRPASPGSSTPCVAPWARHHGTGRRGSVRRCTPTASTRCRKTWRRAGPPSVAGSAPTSQAGRHRDGGAEGGLLPHAAAAPARAGAAVRPHARRRHRQLIDTVMVPAVGAAYEQGWSVRRLSMDIQYLGPVAGGRGGRGLGDAAGAVHRVRPGRGRHRQWPAGGHWQPDLQGHAAPLATGQLVGSRTAEMKKSSIWRMTSTKRSKSTGLVT